MFNLAELCSARPASDDGDYSDDPEDRSSEDDNSQKRIAAAGGSRRRSRRRKVGMGSSVGVLWRVYGCLCIGCTCLL